MGSAAEGWMVDAAMMIHTLRSPDDRIFLRFEDNPGSLLWVRCEEWQHDASGRPYNEQFFDYIPTENDIHACPPLKRFESNSVMMMHSEGKALWDSLRRCGWVYVVTFDDVTKIITLPPK